MPEKTRTKETILIALNNNILAILTRPILYHHGSNDFAMFLRLIQCFLNLYEYEVFISQIRFLQLILGEPKKERRVNSPTPLNKSYNYICITIFTYLEKPLVVND